MNSPCVRNCCLDDNDICLGCYRSLEEIRQWGLVSEEQQQSILQLCESRRREKHARCSVNSEPNQLKDQTLSRS